MTNTQSPAPGVAADELLLYEKWAAKNWTAFVSSDFGRAPWLAGRAELRTALQASAAAVEPAYYQYFYEGQWVNCSKSYYDHLRQSVGYEVRTLYTAPPLPAQVQAAEIEEILACLDDDAVTLLDENPEDEIAHNIKRAATLIESLLASRTPAPGMAGGVGAENPLIPWQGTDDSFDGPLPDGTIADLKFRGGEVICGCKAWDYTWRDRGAPDDIIAYRVSAAPHPSPAPQAAGADAEKMLDWLLDGKRSKRIWNHVLTDEEKAGHNFIKDVLRAAIEAGRAGS